MVLAAAVIGAALSASAAEPRRIFDETPAQRDERMSWWRHDRFGMFIHFGLYAVPARGEWVKSVKRLSEEDYDRYFRVFNPDRFDARRWVAAAKRAGMKYMVLTAKHHDGFCLFDSRLTDYKITNTKFGRDLVKEYVDACHEAGMKVGFYYSLPDWHHPEYPIDRYHPRRPVPCGPWDREGMEGPEEPWNELNRTRRMEKYREYLHGQVRELLTNYGKIDVMWFDFTVDGPRTKSPDDWQSERLIRTVRELQPGIVVNDRLGLGETTWDGWDFMTPEQHLPTPKTSTRHGRPADFEMCYTFSGEWGYHRDSTTWKSPKQCIALLVKAVSCGGNLLMNVGPTARGEFDCRAMERLEDYGKWMDDNSDAIYGCTRPPEGFVAPEGTALTYNPSTGRLYVHILDYPSERLACAFADRVEFARFLSDASEIPVQHGAFILPRIKPPTPVPVIEVLLR